MTRIPCGNAGQATFIDVDVQLRRDSNNSIIADPCHPFQIHTHTAIFLHDLSNNAEDLAINLFSTPTSDQRFLPIHFPTCKWVFPQAKLRRSTRFPSKTRYQWFDMWTLEDPEFMQELQLDGLNDSVSQILDIIRDEILELGSGDAAERIILGGIGQGCATALLALMHGSIQLGSFISISSWLPFRAEMERIAERPLMELFSDPRHMFDGVDFMPWEKLDLDDLTHSRCMLETPVFVYHADGDEVVPIEHGRKLCDGLGSLGMVVTSRLYEEGGHWVCKRGVDDVVAFLKKYALE